MQIESHIVLISAIVYSIAFGVLSAIAVENKNRSGENWFLIGLFFGIFGLIAALIVDKVVRQPTKFDPSKQTKKCPDCAETIKLKARVCRYCQYRYNDNEVTKQIAAVKKAFLKKRNKPSKVFDTAL